MERVIKEKLEEVVALMNDPEAVVLEKEVKEKLEKVLSLLNNPGEIATEAKDSKAKLEKVVKLVTNTSVDPDIDVDFFIPGVKTTVEAPEESGDPYIQVTYTVSEYTKPTRKFHLGHTAGIYGSAEEIANQVTFFIEEFKGEIDSVEMG